MTTEEQPEKLVINVSFQGWKAHQYMDGMVGDFVTDPPFEVEYASGRTHSWRLWSRAFVTGREKMQCLSKEALEKLMASKMQQAMFTLNIVLKETIELGRLGFIMKHRKIKRKRGRMRQQARPVKDFRMLDAATLVDSTGRPLLQ